jgi:hypothetical protein
MSVTPTTDSLNEPQIKHYINSRKGSKNEVPIPIQNKILLILSFLSVATAVNTPSTNIACQQTLILYAYYEVICGTNSVLG